ncbi:similar to ILITYHIA [Actinidia rufa]|uniref:Similar to ILITYHIA n=1 Tax=Actinidia rufa TaxID=165716 RepID=A0A7J0GUK1_9ERIC|nr:similar to ILITYHIA [Actinidia rufa]
MDIFFDGEVMGNAGKSQLSSFVNELIPTIRTVLCDSIPEVRESAGLAFSTLYKSAGMQAIDEIIPTLLHALEDDQTSDTALDGLKQILSVRTTAVLPRILPKLVHPPFSTVVPTLLTAMGDDNMEVQNLAKKAAEAVVLVIDEEGIEPLISELLKGVGDHQTKFIISDWILLQKQQLYLVDEAPNMISILIILLSDSDSTTVAGGLISGSAELREQTAQGLGELVELTSEQALKEFVIPITGASDPDNRTVRSRAAVALGKLSALSNRVDPLVGDLVSSLQASDGGVREAILTALKGVLKYAGKTVSSTFRTRVYTVLKDLICDDDDQI